MTPQNESDLTPANRNTIRSQDGILQESNTYKVNFNLIRANVEFNVREEYTEIEELADNILVNGLINPLLGVFVTIEGVTYFNLTDGFRRYKAFELNIKRGHKVGEIPCRSTPMSLEQRIIAMIVTQDNIKLKGVEFANSLKILKNLGMKPDDIAKSISKSITFVTDMLLLSEQTSTVKEAVKGKKASATAVIATAKEIGPDRTKKVVEESINKNEKFTVEKANEIKEESEMKKQNSNNKLEFSKPSELVMPKTLEGMKIYRDELLALKDRSHKQVKFLNELIEKIKIREDLEQTAIKVNTVSLVHNGELNFSDKFDTILWTKFCSMYCEKLGMETCTEIFNLFKTELSSNE